MEKIGHVLIDDSFNQGTMTYSDGLIEHELLRLVRTENIDYQQILAKDCRWPILYHLSPVRRNLLEWYPFSPEGSLLEIGAGCGALTGLFSERTKRVVALELSRLRAEILAWRHKERQNLSVLVGDLNHIDITEKFDYITLIGVLEYAAQPAWDLGKYIALLNKVGRCLAPDGVLLLAIENKFGLKYWAGAPEDHTGKPFDGLSGYISSDAVRTFSHSELDFILREAGFGIRNFYYPTPDYKMPVEIYSKEHLPRFGQLGGGDNYSAERISVFNEHLVRNSLISSDDFSFFADSFLVECRQENL